MLNSVTELKDTQEVGLTVCITCSRADASLSIHNPSMMLEVLDTDEKVTLCLLQDHRVWEAFGKQPWEWKPYGRKI